MKLFKGWRDRRRRRASLIVVPADTDDTPPPSVIPPRHDHGPHAPIELEQPYLARIDATNLELCLRSIEELRVLRLNYIKRSEVTERLIEPAKLVRLHFHWYVLAWDRLREDWRTFRIDRFESADLTREHYFPRERPSTDPLDILRHHFFGCRSTTAVVQLAVSMREAYPRLGTLDLALSSLGREACRVEAFVDSLDELTQLLIATDTEFTIESPLVFAEEVHAVGLRLVRASEALALIDPAPTRPPIDS